MVFDEIELHDCWSNSFVAKCDWKTDILKCDICGAEWECKCCFDQDY